VQELYILRLAIAGKVSRECLARAFNANTSSINCRINPLRGICPEAIDLRQDKQFTPDVTGITRNMRAARQVEVVGLIADCLVKTQNFSQSKNKFGEIYVHTP